MAINPWIIFLGLASLVAGTGLAVETSSGKTRRRNRLVNTHTAHAKTLADQRRTDRVARGVSGKSVDLVYAHMVKDAKWAAEQKLEEPSFLIEVGQSPVVRAGISLLIGQATQQLFNQSTGTMGGET